MAIAAKISATEIDDLIRGRFVDTYLEARLINAPGVDYTPGTTNDTTFLGNEVALGTGGYKRQVIGYTSGQVGTYGDSHIAMAQKATVFAHDGGGTDINFSHAALVWSNGNALTLGAVTTAPTAAVDGTYTDIPIDSTSGSGASMTVDLTVTNSGAGTGDYAVTIRSAGYDFAASDTVTILEGTLAGLGIVAGGAGNLAFSVATVSSQAQAGQLFTTAKTTNAVVLTGGNEAVFYWNVRQYGIAVA